MDERSPLLFSFFGFFPLEIVTRTEMKRVPDVERYPTITAQGVRLSGTARGVGQRRNDGVKASTSNAKRLLPTLYVCTRNETVAGCSPVMRPSCQEIAALTGLGIAALIEVPNQDIRSCVEDFVLQRCRLVADGD